jgi:hypothetical protein
MEWGVFLLSTFFYFINIVVISHTVKTKSAADINNAFTFLKPIYYVKFFSNADCQPLFLLRLHWEDAVLCFSLITNEKDLNKGK